MTKTPRMTRAHFQLIADVLKQNHASVQLCESFARSLRTTNANFDTNRFIYASQPTQEELAGVSQ